MQTYLHPDTNVPVMGVRLGAWAQIRRGDFYASTRGDWEPIAYEGMILQPGCEVPWVRRTEVSDEGKALLSRMARGFRPASIGYSYAATELAKLGLIAASVDPDRYDITDAGIELLELLRETRS